LATLIRFISKRFSGENFWLIKRKLLWRQIAKKLRNFVAKPLKAFCDKSLLSHSGNTKKKEKENGLIAQRKNRQSKQMTFGAFWLLCQSHKNVCFGQEKERKTNMASPASLGLPT